MPTKRSKRRAKGPKCVICGKPAVVGVMPLFCGGFRVVPIRPKAKTAKRRKTSAK